MRYQLTFWICLTLIIGYCFPLSAQEATQPAKSPTQAAPATKKKEFADFAKVTEDSKSYEGFFKLHQKKGNLYCEIQPSQLDKPFLCMTSVARGIGRGRLIAGMTLEEWLLVWRRVGDKCPSGAEKCTLPRQEGNTDGTIG